MVEELGADGFAYGSSQIEGAPNDVVVRLTQRASVNKGDVIYVTTDPR